MHEAAKLSLSLSCELLTFIWSQEALQPFSVSLLGDSAVLKRCTSSSFNVGRRAVIPAIPSSAFVCSSSFVLRQKHAIFVRAHQLSRFLSNGQRDYVSARPRDVAQAESCISSSAPSPTPSAASQRHLRS